MNILALLLVLTQPSVDLVEDNILNADLVMTGSVVKTYNLHMHDDAVSDNDPEFRVAIVRQDEILKRNEGVLVTGRGVMVVYVNSQDAAWAESPKLQREQKALFVLSLATIEQGGSHEPRSLLIASDAIDVLDEDQLDRVKRVLKRRK